MAKFKVTVTFQRNITAEDEDAAYEKAALLWFENDNVDVSNADSVEIEEIE